jgi:hypothetical protein
MAAQDCIDIIKKAAGEDLSDNQLEEILTLLDRRSKRRMKDDPSLSKEKAFAEAAEELAAEKRLAALIEKRNRAINIIRKQTIEDRIANTRQKTSTALQALVYGVEGKFYGAGESTDAKIYALKQSMRGALIHDLDSAGLLEAARKGNREFEAEVAREMSRLNGNTKIAPVQNQNAAKLAAILQKHTEAARLVQNDAGAYIRKMDGYVTRQSHDQVKIHKAGYKKWRDAIAPLLDERTFDDVDDPEAMLRSVYTNLASGNHLKAGGASDFLGGFTGAGNLAKRASSERVLHFKGPDEWMKYNDAFGRSTLYESVLDAVDYGARNAALMRDWGTNPENMFTAIREKAILDAKKEGNAKETQALSAFGLQRAFDELTATVDIPGNVTLARIGSSTRLLQAMSKLGGMVLSSIPDLGVRAATLRHNGVSVGERFTSGISDLFRNYSKSDAGKIARYMGFGIDGMTGDIFRQMSSLDTTPGKMAKVADRFFKATGQTWWQDRHTAGVGVILARQMADNIGTKFGELDGLYRTTLTRYGIGEKEWTALSKADTKAADGENFLTPDAARTLDDATVRGLIGKADAGPRALNAARRDLEAKLQTYLHDQIREAMTIAGARERSMLNLGTTAGTYGGEAIRLLMQFKTYPTTFLRRSINRELNRAQDGEGFRSYLKNVDYGGVGQLIAATTVLGFASLAVKDIAKGREPRWPEDPADQAKLWMAAMKQGGGLGIYGDFLLGETNRVGGTWGNTLLGPTFGGTLLDIEKVLNAARKGEDPSAQAVRGITANTPFANLFYARWAMDYTFLYALQDAVDPGSVRRQQRKIERENKQEYLLPPSSYTNDPLRNLQQLGRDVLP